VDKPTRESIIEAAKEAATRSNGPLSKREFTRLTGISDRQIYYLFPQGGWTEIKELAGLAPHPKVTDPLSDEQLLAEFHRVVSELSAIPSWHAFASMATVGPDTLQRRFHGRQGTLQRYKAWLEQNHPDAPMLQLLPIKSKHEIVTPAVLSRETSQPTQWAKSSGVVFGAPMHFRGLRHAPTNEQGVVYLFGMVSSELGLIVEAIQQSFPDCEAKRCVDAKLNRWQRVRIEFEFRSSHFHEHGHDPAGCDMIVCWEHDWPECPLEVIELRSVIDQLEG